jgi:hypothetical protein
VKSLDVAIDQARVGLGEGGIAQAEPDGGSAADRVQEHVAACREAVQCGAAVGGFEIEHDAALVAVVGEIQRPHSFRAARADGAGDVALRPFHLDDIGAHVAEILRRHRPEDDRGQIEHDQPVQRTRRG